MKAPLDLIEPSSNEGTPGSCCYFANDFTNNNSGIHVRCIVFTLGPEELKQREIKWTKLVDFLYDYFSRKAEQKFWRLLTRTKVVQARSGPGGGLHLKLPKFDRNLNTYLSCHNFSPLSSVQILLIPACCLLCVL